MKKSRQITAAALLLVAFATGNGPQTVAKVEAPDFGTQTERQI